MGYTHQEDPTPIYLDAESAKAIAEGHKHMRGVRHFKVRYHFIREAIENGDMHRIASH